MIKGRDSNSETWVQVSPGLTGIVVGSYRLLQSGRALPGPKWEAGSHISLVCLAGSSSKKSLTKPRPKRN